MTQSVANTRSGHDTLQTESPNPPPRASTMPSSDASNGEQNLHAISDSQAARIRFSADLGGGEVGQHENQALSESYKSKQTNSPNSIGDGSGQILEEALTRSPGAMSIPEFTAPGPSSLPARNRGYSLRRSLFAKSVRTQPEGSGSIMELATSPNLTSGAGANIGKSRDATSVIVSPALEDNSSDLPSRSNHFGSKAFHSPRSGSWYKLQSWRSVASNKLNGVYQRARKTILRIQDIPPSADGRHIDLGNGAPNNLMDERTKQPYISNSIRSSRYTLANFFPRQLFAQFSKLANFYFLCISILQMIPGLSTTGTYTTIVPLLIFVGISMFKEGYDDLRRYRLDKEENQRKCRTLEMQHINSSIHNGTSSTAEPFTEQLWQDVSVGNIVKVERDQAVPADIVLLGVQSSEGIAYVETMALDGETNLKSKQPSPPLAKRAQNGPKTFDAQFVVEDPNLNLYNFDGRVTVEEETLPLTNSEIIYRGSILRNTSMVWGLVVYTGEECKIRMNANKNPRIKAPTLQLLVNRVVVIIVAFVITLAVFNTVAYQIWHDPTEAKSWYLISARVSAGPNFTSFIIMFNTMIPLSLYVSMEIVKLVQMYLLNDIDMYDETSNTPLEARTSTINEELGQVSYIFSDKTGTLTDNSMRFRKMSVAGTAWLHDHDLIGEQVEAFNRNQKEMRKRNSKGKKPVQRKSTASTVGPPRKSNVSSVHGFGPSYGREFPRGEAKKEHLGGRVEDMINYMHRKPHTLFARKARFFFLAIALCHTCVPEKDQNENITYQAASPDELALVTAAQELGYIVIDRQHGQLKLKIAFGSEEADTHYETYEILNVVEFSSARKRMSVIVRMPDHRICVFCKGADSTITDLLRLADLARSKVVEVERRAHQRKSLEASEAMRRQSGIQSPKSSLARISMSRASMGALPSRKNSVNPRKSSLRDGIDLWLRERETDVGMRTHRDSAQFYSPRPSVQLDMQLSPRTSLQHGGRSSASYLDHRSSFQADESGDLVEESMVINDSVVFERCFQHINDFATEGLRTLMYASRYLTEEEYINWKTIFQAATTSLIDRQEHIESAAEIIETQFELVGATAIEDRLQKGVPATLDKLRRANIKLWMLTGDKRETAINIGKSARLVKDYSTITILDRELGELDQQIARSVSNLQTREVAHSVIVIDGITLGIIESDPQLLDLFLKLAILASSVICCRASPSQKAFLVKAVRQRVRQSVTLAIGDGANDIAMIQEAHVGIGITGKEGLQAARSSDYSIAQFRFLLKLLLVHGRWNYNRICKYTLGTFWKECLFYLTQALYQRWAGYTGTSLYESWSLSMFNTLFTSLPVIFLGIFEKDLAPATLLAVPELYTFGQQNTAFNIPIYLFWTFLATCEAMIIYFTMFGLYGVDGISSSDKPGVAGTNDLYALGTLTFTTCIITIATKLQVLELHNKSVAAPIALFLSIGGWFLWDLILSGTYSTTSESAIIYRVRDSFLHRFGATPLWWLTLILTVTSTVFFEIAVKAVKAAVFPGDVEVFQQLEKDPEVKKRFEEASIEELGRSRERTQADIEIEREMEEKEKEEREREEHVRALLERPRTMESEGLRRRPSVPVPTAEEGIERQSEDEQAKKRGSTHARRSLDAQEMFSKGFGVVWEGEDMK